MWFGNAQFNFFWYHEYEYSWILELFLFGGLLRTIVTDYCLEKFVFYQGFFTSSIGQMDAVEGRSSSPPRSSQASPDVEMTLDPPGPLTTLADPFSNSRQISPLTNGLGPLDLGELTASSTDGLSPKKPAKKRKTTEKNAFSLAGNGDVGSLTSIPSPCSSVVTSSSMGGLRGLGKGRTGHFCGPSLEC